MEQVKRLEDIEKRLAKESKSPSSTSQRPEMGKKNYSVYQAMTV